MATFDEFFPYVQPSLNSCPNPIVRQAILQTAIDYCKKSLCWTQRLSPVPYIANKSKYVMSLPGDSRLVEVLNVFGPDRELDGKSFDELVQIMPAWNTQMGNPIYFVVDPSEPSIELFPKPNADATGRFIVRVALTPSYDAEELPDVLLSLHQDAITFGTLSRLLITANQPWSNAELGADYRQRYGVECDNARIEYEHGKRHGSISVKPRRFGWPGR